MGIIAATFRGLALTAALVALTSAAGAGPAAPQFSEPFTPVDAAAEASAMGPGVNLLGYDPVWRDPGKARFMPGHFRIIRQAGFKNVRVVLQAFDFIGADGKLDAQWLATLDGFVKAALDAGLIVVLDEHNFQFCAKDAATCRVKLNAFWTEIAARYKDAPNRLVFEILNEPHGALTPELWNRQLAETLSIIRASNPTRNVVIGPAMWNTLDVLPLLQLPEADRHIIVTFHYYKPMEFTHQGAAWAGPQYANLSGVTWGTPEEQKILSQQFDLVKTWSLAHDRPIYLGEFGAYDKAAMSERAKWTTAVRQAAEVRGFAFAWWQFDGDFVLWDHAKPGWVEPILNALIAPKQQ